MTNKNLIATDGEHSDIMGGSTAAQRIHCPGSYQLEKPIPKGETSVHAEKGTALHMAMEDYLLNYEENYEPIEALLDNTYNGFTIDQEMIDDKLRPALVAFGEVIEMMGGDLDYMVEVKASMGELIPGAFGTVDILGVGADGRLLVLDWKFGDGVKVNPEANYQHGFYAAAAIYDNDPEVKELVDSATGDPIVFVIVQPRARRDEPTWSFWEAPDAWTDNYVDLMVDAYHAAQGENPPLKTGDHCRWCRAKIVCPEQQRGAQSALTSVRPALMDSVTLSTWLDRMDQLDDFVSSVRAHAHKELEAGVAIPGWKMVDKRASRVYIDKAEAEATLRKMSGVKVADIMNHTLKNPAQLEKSIPKKKYEAFAKDHVSMVSSGTKIVRDSDTRADVSDPLSQLARATSTQK